MRIDKLKFKSLLKLTTNQHWNNRLHIKNLEQRHMTYHVKCHIQSLSKVKLIMNQTNDSENTKMKSFYHMRLTMT